MKSEGQPTLARVAEQGMSDAGAMLAAGGTLQQTQTGYATAIQVQRPRELKQVQKAVLEEAELAGEDFFYAWTTKNKDGTRGLVEGISIEGAMIMARNWGNCAIPCRIEKDMPREWLMTGAFVDLETGFTVERPFRQRKSQATGKMDADRALDIALQIGVSKAQRNAIVQAMPKWLKGTALEKSKAAAEGKFKNVKGLELVEKGATPEPPEPRINTQKQNSIEVQHAVGRTVELWNGGKLDDIPEGPTLKKRVVAYLLGKISGPDAEPQLVDVAKQHGAVDSAEKTAKSIKNTGQLRKELVKLGFETQEEQLNALSLNEFSDIGDDFSGAYMVAWEKANA